MSYIPGETRGGLRKYLVKLVIKILVIQMKMYPTESAFQPTSKRVHQLFDQYYNLQGSSYRKTREC